MALKLQELHICATFTSRTRHFCSTYPTSQVFRRPPFALSFHNWVLRKRCSVSRSCSYR